MIIRHDLKLIFLHVPKCAGTAIRRVFREGSSDPANVQEFWNYSFNDVLERYVDRAHLPLSDFRSYPEFDLLDDYTVIACTRHPQARLRSAVHEYYRQKSARHEAKIKKGQLTDAMKRRYYRQLHRRHLELDPRFIHSLPMHRFTHYGRQPKVDHLLRCESLLSDFEQLAQTLRLPESMLHKAATSLHRNDRDAATCHPDQQEVELSERLYAVDFQTFGYGNATTPTPGPIVDAGQARFIHASAQIQWHWGPRASRSTTDLAPTR